MSKIDARQAAHNAFFKISRRFGFRHRLDVALEAYESAIENAPTDRVSDPKAEDARKLISMVYDLRDRLPNVDTGLRVALQVVPFWEAPDDTGLTDNTLRVSLKDIVCAAAIIAQDTPQPTMRELGEENNCPTCGDHHRSDEVPFTCQTGDGA